MKLITLETLPEGFSVTGFFGRVSVNTSLDFSEDKVTENLLDRSLLEEELASQARNVSKNQANAILGVRLSFESVSRFSASKSNTLMYYILEGTAVHIEGPGFTEPSA